MKPGTGPEELDTPWTLLILRLALCLDLAVQVTAGMHARLGGGWLLPGAIGVLYGLLLWGLWVWVTRNYVAWFRRIRWELPRLEETPAKSRILGFSRTLPGQDRLGWTHAPPFLLAALPLALFFRSPEVMILGAVLWLLGVYVVSQRVITRFYMVSLDLRDQAVMARLAPHFFYNVLNTLHAQIESDPRGAQKTTQRLGELFRRTVDFSRRSLVSLHEELEFVESYLELERVRFGGRLKVRVEVPEELEDVLVPPFCLQLLAENAIKHGISSLEEGGEVALGGEVLEGGTLRLWVEDPASGSGAAPGTGTGLEVLRQRLDRPGDLVRETTPGGRHRVSFTWKHAP